MNILARVFPRLGEIGSREYCRVPGGDRQVIDYENYIKQLTKMLQESIGDRLLYVGLQGSYLRGEANENSDIDIMVVIDGLKVADMDLYKEAISRLEEVEKSCGFIAGKEEMAHWNPLEICHLLHTTKDYYGKLEELVPAYTEQDIRNFVTMSVNNLFHEICHRYIHRSWERNVEALPGSYKGVFFILQNLHFLEQGDFVQTKQELLAVLTGKNKQVLAKALEFGKGETYDFDEAYELLFSWCQETINQCK